MVDSDEASYDKGLHWDIDSVQMPPVTARSSNQLYNPAPGRAPARKNVLSGLESPANLEASAQRFVDQRRGLPIEKLGRITPSVVTPTAFYGDLIPVQLGLCLQSLLFNTARSNATVNQTMEIHMSPVVMRLLARLIPY